MAAKAITLLVLFLVAFLFIVSEVAARDLVENPDATESSEENDQYYGGGRGGYGGGRGVYGGGRGGYGGGRGGYGGGRGGYGGGRGGYGGGRGGGGYGRGRCCDSADEKPDADSQAQPQN